MNFFSLLKSAINKFFGKNETVVSHEMQTESEITTDEKSPYKAIVDDFTNRLDAKFETALAFGGMMFKPYLSHGKILIDLIRADCFIPVVFIGKTMTSVVFVSKKTGGNACFPLIEYHKFNAENHTHTIKNKVCKSLNSEIIGWECPFREVCDS